MLDGREDQAAGLRRLFRRAPPQVGALYVSGRPPADNAPAVAGAPLATRAVMIGTEGPSLPACSSISRVKDGGTDVYWAPGETRAVKAKLPGAMKVSVCGATDDDAWFGTVFAAPGTDEDMCGVGRSVSSARE